MTDYLEGPDQKVKRAYKHIDELEAVYDGFLHREPKPYAILPDKETEPGRIVLRASIREDPPLSIATILGDIFQNLRSALDYLACQCVLFGNGTVSRNTAFPISETPEEFEAALQSKVGEAPENCLDLIRAAKPYKGGNDLLWQLHHLNRLDKHRLLSVVAGAVENTLRFDPFRAISKVWAEVSDKPLSREIVPILSIKGVGGPMFPLKDGDVITSQPAKDNTDLYFAFYIGLGQAGYAEGEPVLSTSRKFADEVTGLVEAFRPVLV